MEKPWKAKQTLTNVYQETMKIKNHERMQAAKNRYGLFFLLAVLIVYIEQSISIQESCKYFSNFFIEFFWIFFQWKVK